MSEIVPFNYDDYEIRVVMINGKPWFVAADIAAVLGYHDATSMVRTVRDHQKGTHPVRTSNGVMQDMIIISRAGLSRLIMRSDKEDADRFQDWVTDEVLESIADTGTYGLEQIDLPTALERYAAALREQQAATARAIDAEHQVEELQPKALEYDFYMDSTGTCDLGALGQALGGGRQRLIDRLRELDVLVSQVASQQGGVRPMQRYVEKGWFEVKLEVTNVGPKYVTYATAAGASGVLRKLVEFGIGGRPWRKQLPSESELLRRIFSAEEDRAS